MQIPSLDLRLNQFWRIYPRLVLGVRLEYRKAGADAPFYALPWVKLRGIPAFRYLGRHVVMSEVERAYNYGGGVCYLIARRLGLAMGLDLARGPEDTTGYLTVGRAW